MTCLVTCFSWKHKTFVTAWSFGKAEDSHFNMFFYMFFYVFHPSFVKCSKMFSFLLSCGKFSGHRRKLWDATADPKPGDLGNRKICCSKVRICDDLDGISMHFARALHANKHLGDQLSSLRVTWLTSHLYLIVLQMSSQMSSFTREVNEIAEWLLPPRLSAL